VSGGKSSLILDLDAMLRWVISLTFWPLYPRESIPRQPLD